MENGGTVGDGVLWKICCDLTDRHAGIAPCRERGLEGTGGSGVGVKFPGVWTGWMRLKIRWLKCTLHRTVYTKRSNE